MQAAQAAGSCFFTRTDGDGDHGLHVYVDEPIPSDLAEFALDPLSTSAFDVPDGELLFAGGEYLCKSENELSRKYPHMLTSCKVPRGTYAATFYRMEFPGRVIRERVDSRLSVKERVLVSLPGFAAWPVLGGVLVALLILFSRGASLSSAIAAIVATIGVLLWLSIFRLASFKQAMQHRDELESSLPSMVALLHRRVEDA